MNKKSSRKTTFVTVKGDALELFFGSKTDAVFAHGANCQKTMGAGIAEQVRQKLAPLYYLDQYDTRDATQRLGSYSAVVVGKASDKIKIGLNLYTQFYPGAHFDVNALRNSLRAFKQSIPGDKRADFDIFMPMIGCGIGGGKWEIVEPVLKKELSEFNVIVVEYKPKTEIKEEK